MNIENNALTVLRWTDVKFHTFTLLLTIDGNPFRICEGEKTKRYREPWLD